MEPVREDCIEGDLEVARLHVLVSMSREKLRKAKEDIERLQNTQYEEPETEIADLPQTSVSQGTEEMDEDLSHLSAREKERLLRRIKNREAARRSRHRKHARMQQLSRTVDALERENLILLQCIQEFSQKALDSKALEKEIQMRYNKASSSAPEQTQDGIPLLQNLDGLHCMKSDAPLTDRSSGRTRDSTALKSALDEQLAALSSRDISPRDEENNIDAKKRPGKRTKALEEEKV